MKAVDKEIDHAGGYPAGSSSVSSDETMASDLGLPLEQDENDQKVHALTSRSSNNDTSPRATPLNEDEDERRRDVIEQRPRSDSTETVRRLEERVIELESKLSTLARLWQLQTSSSAGDSTATPSSMNVPSPDISNLLKEEKLHPRSRNSHNQSTAAASFTEELPPSVPDLGSDSDHDHEEDQAPVTPPSGGDTLSVESFLGSSNTTVPHLESPATLMGLNETRELLLAGGDHHNKRLHKVDELTASTSSSTSHQTPSPRNNRSHRGSKHTTGGTRTSSRHQQHPSHPFPPLPGTPDQRPALSQRNLSFKLLYGGDEALYTTHHPDPSATSSMTPAERRWLGSFLKAKQEAHNVPDDTVRNKWLDYLNSFQESTHDVDLQMEEFVKVPGEVERIMAFGFSICIDSFLYTFTILPIRFIWSILLLIIRLGSWKRKTIEPSYQFHRRHTYQMIQVLILYCVYQYVLAPISIGKFYHWIRGQAMIKLYVLIAMVEVFDRLMCSLGQDCMDSMYWNAVNRPKSSRMLISVAVVLIYATCHTLLLFLHVATLNVAMNSADQALLTLFISGNFAEIKSTVFKKYNKAALFKLTASDVCERFKLGLFLGIVLILNISQGMDEKQAVGYLRVCGIVVVAELLADWIKHSFITKFNMQKAKVYKEYSLLLAGDFTGIGHEGVNLDHSHAVVKRIGFAQLPLVCVMFRFMREAAKYASMNHKLPSLSSWVVGCLAAAVWFLLLAMKLALGSHLQKASMNKLNMAPEILSVPSAKKKKQ